MKLRLSKTVVSLGLALAVTLGCKGMAAGSNSNHDLHAGAPNPAPPAHNSPFVVPYACGSSVSSVYTHNALIVKSDPNGNAGFEIYSSQASTKVPFPPGQLSFSVSGAVNGDSIEIVEFNVNGVSNGTNIYLNNGVFSINLSNLTTANIKEMFVGIETTNSTISLSNFKLNNHAIAVDLTHTATCESRASISK